MNIDICEETYDKLPNAQRVKCARTSVYDCVCVFGECMLCDGWLCKKNRCALGVYFRRVRDIIMI